jgi:hypothetical protein
MIMPKTIYIVDPTTRELLSAAIAPLDPVASERAGKLVYAEVNSDNATDQLPPKYDKEADDVVLNSKGDWEVKRGAKAKRKEDAAVAATEAEAQNKAEQLKAQLAAMTETERKLHSMREEDPVAFDAFDAFEAEIALQTREAQALERFSRHEKHRADKAKENNGNGSGNGSGNNSNNSNDKKQVNTAK